MQFVFISTQEKIIFFKNLSIMLRSGIMLDEALQLSAEQTTIPAFQKILTTVYEDIQKGSRFSRALEKYPTIFDRVDVSLVRIGEESGTLQENLAFLVSWMLHSDELRRDVGNATLYPKMVFGATILLGFGLATLILPRLIPLFSQLHVELPFITKMLLAFTQFLQGAWLWVLSSLVFVIIMFIILNRIPRIRLFFHTLYLRIPVFGPLLREYQLALLFQLFASLYKSGISIANMLDLVARAATNDRYAKSVKQIQVSVNGGTTLSVSMSADTALYPKMAQHIVATGEKSGTLYESFEYLAEHFSKEVRTKTKKLPTIIEPLLLIFIAVSVGLIALAIIMPLYQLTGSVTR